eukprot:m.9824 g.9824  ORF g.9824 m.9824 type:complete len:80 (+) comp3609_c0_seq1:2559-2798(+)
MMRGCRPLNQLLARSGQAADRAKVTRGEWQAAAQLFWNRDQGSSADAAVEDALVAFAPNNGRDNVSGTGACRAFCQRAS